MTPFRQELECIKKLHRTKAELLSLDMAEVILFTAMRSPEPGEGPALEPSGAQGGCAPPQEPRETVPSVGGEFTLEVDWVRAVREGVDPEACDEHG